MLAEHDEAHGQRRCHQQPERPPQPRPERDGHEQHHLRHADRPGIQHRFEHEIREQLEDDEQGEDDQWTRPPLQGRETDEDRRAGREHGTDVRDESKRRTQRRPDQWVRDVEEVQSDEDRDAVQQTHKGLHQQLPADATSGLVECLRGRGELSLPDQPDQAIPQIAAFEQHEDDHHRDEPRRAQRPDDGPEPREARETRHLVGGHHEGPRHGSFRCLRRLQVSLDARQRVLQLLDRASPARKAHVGNLRSDVGAIAGQVFDQIDPSARSDPSRRDREPRTPA